VGAWRVLGLHALGSFGVVYQVEHDSLGGPLALKLARQPGDPRFALEVELLSRTQHPNVPRLHDSGQWSGPGGALFPFFVMDWVQGLPLYSWARLRPRSSRELLRVLAQAASALQAVHSAGGVHRDFKGDNLLVRPEDGRATLVDFGSCTFRGAPVLTRQSEPPGTPHYHSPQAQLHQWRFRRHASARYVATAADDVYALGVTAYRVAAGRYPLIAEELSTDTAVEDLFSFPALVPVDQLVQLSPELARWIRQMMAVKPEARGTVAELPVGMALSADTEGPEADRPIGPRTAATQVKPQALSPTPRQELPRRTVFALVAAGVGLMAAGGLLHALLAPSSSESVREHEQVARASSQDGDTTALGEAGLAEPPSPPQPEASQKRISAPVPPEPLAGQRLPPCKKPQVEINGGCWIPIAGESPPCIETTYEWRKQCYMPFFSPPRPSTSGER
jgi:serine/threonine protein kinase